jgi:hypothetical protein
MPTLVKARNRERVADEPETKEEPKVIVDKGLAKLVQEWDSQDKKAGGYWIRICEYVAENDITRAQLKKALMDLRGMAEVTANNEVSKIFKMRDNPDVLEQLKDGEITQREAREAVTKKQEGTDDAETKLKKQLNRAASFAINEVEAESGEFVTLARGAYKDQYAKIEARKAREEEGEEVEGDEEEEEE